MRPLELTVEGFRSYRGPTTFDWRDRRLVGIVGPIGAGKSSILDAVAFALYGKTPGVVQNTKSLIHQLCDQAHVALTFEVDGQVWKAVRAPKRKGQSGHQLHRLAEDSPDAASLDTVEREGPVNARIEGLLGMDFAAFCRSVLLAQNRFSEFLTATPTERDKVLKGVFGYERLDAAKTTAERRLDREEATLEALARERTTVQEARTRLEEARIRAGSAEARLKAFDDAAPEIDRHRQAQVAADADRIAAEQRIGALESIARTLPPGDQVEAVLSAARQARGSVDEARGVATQAEGARAAADAELALVHERLGDREQLRSFEKLVDRHTALAEAAALALEAHRLAEDAQAAAAADLEGRLQGAVEAAEAAARSEDLLVEASAATALARTAVDEARHAEMAHGLRGTLTAGRPCPVCEQPVASLPRTTAAPKKLASTSKALQKREAAEAKARQGKEGRAAAVGAAETAVSEAEIRAAQAGRGTDAASEGVRAAEAELAAIKDQLTERLGEGEPLTLVSAVEAQLTAAELAATQSSEAMERARRALDLAREQAEEADRAMSNLANALAGAWGGLDEPRAIQPDPEDVRAAFVDAGETIVHRLQEAHDGAKEAADRISQAAEGTARVLVSLGLAPDEDFVAARAEAGATFAAASGAIEELESHVARAGDLERDVLAAEGRRLVAKRLADDLKPSRFLAFLLEEERAELAELGSGLFETLTDDTYRFAADDSFDIVDLNAADRARKADSLSGGETFLASLALALALAQMVARGGGRLDAFFLDEGFGSLDPEHLDRAMDGIGRLVADDDRRLVVLVSHVAEMRAAVEDLIVLDKDDRTGDTVVVSGATLP